MYKVAWIARYPSGMSRQQASGYWAPTCSTRRRRPAARRPLTLLVFLGTAALPATWPGMF